MPNVLLRGPNGDCRQISTSSFRTLADWLLEWVPQCMTADSRYQHTMLEVWPTFDMHGHQEAGWNSGRYEQYQLDHAQDVDRLLNELHEALGRVRAIPDQPDC